MGDKIIRKKGHGEDGKIKKRGTSSVKKREAVSSKGP